MEGEGRHEVGVGTEVECWKNVHLLDYLEDEREGGEEGVEEAEEVGRMVRWEGANQVAAGGPQRGEVEGVVAVGVRVDPRNES